MRGMFRKKHLGVGVLIKMVGFWRMLVYADVRKFSLDK